MTEAYTWERYAQEAGVEPFTLRGTPVGDISITNPSGAQLIAINEALARGDVAGVLRGICGDAYADMMEVFGSIGHKALPKITEDLMDHFDLYEEYRLKGPGGGVVRAKRPTEIRRLLQMGYEIQGEAGGPSRPSS